MKYTVIAARVLMGLIFFVFGLNGFFNFIEAPPMEGDAGVFINLLVSSGFLYVVKVLEVTGGLLLLIGKKIPVALSLLGPVVVNIFLFHSFFAPSGLPMAVVVLVLEVFLIWSHRSSFSAIFAD